MRSLIKFGNDFIFAANDNRRLHVLTLKLVNPYFARHSLIGIALITIGLAMTRFAHAERMIITRVSNTSNLELTLTAIMRMVELLDLIDLAILWMEVDC